MVEVSEWAGAEDGLKGWGRGSYAEWRELVDKEDTCGHGTQKGGGGA